MILAQLALPDKVPETTNQLLAWIVVSVILGGGSLIAFMVRWFVKYLDAREVSTKELSITFAEQGEATRELFRNEQALIRESHEATIDKLNSHHQVLAEK